MEKDHKLDAPDNENLKTIEQLTDRSELTTIYPHGHAQWEGTALMSHDEREEKRDQEQLRISLTIRRWFAVIGALVPLPFILFISIVTYASLHLDQTNISYMFVPVIGAVVLAAYISYRAIRLVRDIFYKHATKAAPFLFILITLVASSVYGLLLVTQSLHTGELFHDVLVISAAAVLTSIMYSGILLLIWASPKLSSKAKVGLIVLLVGSIASLTAFAAYTL